MMTYLKEWYEKALKMKLTRIFLQMKVISSVDILLEILLIMLFENCKYYQRNSSFLWFKCL